VIIGFRYGAAAVFVAAMLTSGATLAQSEQADQDGLRVFKAANCMGCHKWSGTGGGGYGGAAANLRNTTLSLDQIEQTIRCGRLAKGMPHFEEDAYSDGHCYGLKKADLTATQMPPEPDHPLRPADIKAVAKYVFYTLKGSGEPTFAQCQAFFGTGTRACGVYEDQGSGHVQAAAAEQDQASSHPHMKVEAASDANAPR
jgi:Cytochrome C oxidase, cbb3-type, subunit III